MSRRPWYLEFTLPLTSSPSSRRSDTPPQSSGSNSTAPSPSLTPPIRHHLHSLITLPPPAPPPFPSAWIWRCHHCHSIYRLGVTRRCLEDGHFFCSVPSTPILPPSSPSSSISSSTDSSDSELSNPESEQQRLEEERALRKNEKRKRNAQVSCASQFDYTGWEAYNTWRREIRIFSQPVTKTELQYVKRGRLDNVKEIDQRSCEWDCDFPSECAQEREWERQLRILKEEDRFHDDMAVGSRFVPSLITPEVVKSPTSPEEVEREIERIEREFYGKCMEVYELDSDTELEINPTAGRQLPEGERDNEMNLDMPITLALNLGLGIKGLDIDGLGEGDAVAAAAVRERKNSLEDDPPGSPLKESFSFGVGAYEV